jgi:membrane protease YdiL (CAAX protease family)
VPPPSPWPFLGLTFLFTGLAQAPFVLVRLGLISMPFESTMAPLALAALMPSLVALSLATLHGGWRGLREAGRLGPFRASTFGWLLLALGLPTALHLLAAAPLGRIQLYPPLLPEQVAIAVLAPLGEEYGWRGHLLPRLETRYRPSTAAIVVGLVWSLWHAPTWLLPEVPWWTGPQSTILIVGLSVLFSRLWHGAKGNLLIPIGAHLGLHLDNVSRSGDAPVLWATTAVTAALASWLCLRDPQLGRARSGALGR